MPVSHITLRTGHTDGYLDNLSRALHESLVASFEVPLQDCFQVFHQLDGVALRFDPNYLGGPRSEDWGLIEITAGKPRSVETKRRFYSDLATRLEKSLGLAPADVMVVIRHNQAEDWSFSHGIATLIDKEIKS
jgi:hypothetical protein